MSIKKFLINIIPGQVLRKKLRDKYLRKVQSFNIESGNFIDIPKNIMCSITIDGKDNVIKIGNSLAKDLKINISVKENINWVRDNPSVYNVNLMREK